MRMDLLNFATDPSCELPIPDMAHGRLKSTTMRLHMSAGNLQDGIVLFHHLPCDLSILQFLDRLVEFTQAYDGGLQTKLACDNVSQQASFLSNARRLES